MAEFSKTDKTTITRLPKRGSYDRDTVFAILDEALVCTVAYVRDNQPFQIPTGFCRIDDQIYIHGSVGSFYMRELAEKNLPVCVSATLTDGIVLARSAFHHSMNYRSVVCFGSARRVTDDNEAYRAVEVFTNKVQPGRWDDIRKPDAGEWKATMIIAVKIDEASAKIRTGGPKDDDEDYKLDVWAGVLPIQTVRGNPIADDLLKPGIKIPNYL